MFVELRYQLAAQILLLSLLPCCFAVEKFSVGNDKAWCVSYVILFCASLVGIDSWEARNHWSSGARRTMWGTGFLFHTFISEPCLFDVWRYRPYLCFLTSEAPWKFLWGILSYSSQYFGCEKQLACYWWISWRNNMQSLQISSTSLMLIVGTAVSRNWISLVRSQAYHSVLTLKLSLSVCMIVHTAASSRSTANDSTRTLTQHWSCCWQGSVSEIQITGCRN